MSFAAQQSKGVDILAADGAAMAQLRAVRSLALPDWCIAGGFVRNRVWDALTGQRDSYEADTDVLYFDSAQLSPELETALESSLGRTIPEAEWQVRNQARMHLRNGDEPYRDTAHAMTFWLETCTAVGIRLREDEGLDVIAPLGLDDLLGLVFRPTKNGERRRSLYRERLAAKPWRQRWPSATFIL